MKRVLIFAAVAEAATGVALLIVPSLVGRLLFGAELAGVALPVARVTGIALIALGVACWPGPPRVGMLIYNAAVTLYLAYVGFVGGLTGILLWPVVVLHLILTALLTTRYNYEDRLRGKIEPNRKAEIENRPYDHLGKSVWVLAIKDSNHDGETYAHQLPSEEAPPSELATQAKANTKWQIRQGCPEKIARFNHGSLNGGR